MCWCDMPKVIEDWVNQTEVARLLGVSRTQVWRWIQAGKVETAIVGGQTMVPRTEVDRLQRERGNHTGVQTPKG